jgi:hypothetical protein
MEIVGVRRATVPLACTVMGGLGGMDRVGGKRWERCPSSVAAWMAARGWLSSIARMASSLASR